MVTMTQPTFQVAFINPFLTAAEEIFPKLTRQDLATGEPALVSSPFRADGVTVHIGLTGQLHGDFYCSFDDETAKKIASAMMMGMPVTSIDEVATSALAELANQISGNAVTDLAELGYRCNIAPPLVFGPGLEVSGRAPRMLTVPMHSPLGQVVLRIALWEVASL